MFFCVLILSIESKALSSEEKNSIHLLKQLNIFNISPLSNNSFANSKKPLNGECFYYHFYPNKVQFYRRVLSDSLCWLTVHPDSVRLIYRDYLIGDDGLFMVFNSYGRGPIASHTGARFFYFFPRQRLPHAYVENNLLHVETSVNQLTLTMNTQTGRWVKASQGKIQESKTVNKNNRGGIEFQGLPLILLDSGFKIGSDPRKESGFSIFKDQKNKSCQVPNKHIFIFNSQGDIEHKLTTDEDLRSYLQRECPQLDLESLS